MDPVNRLQVLSRQLTAAQPSSGYNHIQDRAPLVASREEWDALYQASIDNPTAFWAKMASNYYWQTKWVDNHTSYNFNLQKGPVFAEFFRGGRTNISFNCLDRWVMAGRGNQPCFLFEGNDIGHAYVMTYQNVLDEVCRVANWLRGQGVVKGEAVTIYMPMVCELPIAMLACARIGAVHSVVFGGFSSDSLAQRILDCQGKVVITASGIMRGAKALPLKQIVDQACATAAKNGFKVQRVLCLEDSSVPREACPWQPGRDVWWREEVAQRPSYCAPEWMDSEDRLFLLYTSGSTGKPKGVVHTTGGYMVAAGVTCRYTFDMQPGDIYFSTADCGWITGHTYLAYGPLLNGVTSVVFAGVPTYPDASRVWSIIEKHKVRIFYTAPTLLRSLLQMGDHHVKKHDRSSLRILGSVGEPINEHAWTWFHDVCGEGRCPIVDTWWQTETGAHMLTPQPGSWCKLKPGCASIPFFGVQTVMLDANGNEQDGPGEGILAIKSAWPSMARTLHGDHDRFQATYFAPFNGYYFTGDGCRRDEDGYIWITGRVDDVINVSGHRIGTAEVEGALTEHAGCAEAAVIGIDHPVKGQAIYAYVTLVDSTRHDDKMRKELMDHVRRAIGPFAVPEVVHWAPALPKTRSGKIMRRVLRKIASGEEKELGDISTLAEPSVVDTLLKLRGV
ncbi:acetyl CoA synthetase [Haematococcus lacustris]